MNDKILIALIGFGSGVSAGNTHRLASLLASRTSDTSPVRFLPFWCATVVTPGPRDRYSGER